MSRKLRKRPTRRARPVIDVPPQPATTAPGTTIADAIDDSPSEAPTAGGVPPGDVAAPVPPASASSADPSSSSASTARNRAIGKFQVYHDGDKFLLDGHTEATREKFVRLVSNTPELTGARAGPAIGALEEIPDELVTALYDGLSGFGAWLLARSGKFTTEQLRILFLTPGEQLAVGPLTKRLLQKHLPAGAGDYADEIALMFMLYSIFQRKQQQLAELLERRGPRGVPAPIEASA